METVSSVLISGSAFLFTPVPAPPSSPRAGDSGTSARREGRETRDDGGGAVSPPQPHLPGSPGAQSLSPRSPRLRRPRSPGHPGMDPRTCCGPGCWSTGSKPEQPRVLPRCCVLGCPVRAPSAGRSAGSSSRSSVCEPGEEAARWKGHKCLISGRGVHGGLEEGEEWGGDGVLPSLLNYFNLHMLNFHKNDRE